MTISLRLNIIDQQSSTQICRGFDISGHHLPKSDAYRVGTAIGSNIDFVWTHIIDKVILFILWGVPTL